MGRPKEIDNIRAKENADEPHGQSDDTIRDPSANQDDPRKCRRLNLPDTPRAQGPQKIIPRTELTDPRADDIAQLMDETTWVASSEDDVQEVVYPGDHIANAASQGTSGTYNRTYPSTLHLDDTQETHRQSAQEILLSLGDNMDWIQSLSSPKGMSQANPIPPISTTSAFAPTPEHVNPQSFLAQETHPLASGEPSSQKIDVQNSTSGSALPGPEHAAGSQTQPERSGSSTEPYMKNCIRQLSDLFMKLYEFSKTCLPTTAVDSSSDTSSKHAAVSSSRDSSSESNVHSFEGALGADAAFSASEDFVQILLSLSGSSHTRASTVPDISGYGPPFTQHSHHDARMTPDTDSWLGQAFPSVASSSSNLMHDADSAAHDGTAILLTLTCYLRLLHIYEPLVRSILRQQQQLRSSDIPHMVHVRVGTFSPSSSSELRVVLLVQIISHLLNRIERAMRKSLLPRLHPQHQEHNASSTQRFWSTMTNGIGRARELSTSSASGYANGLSQNSGVESPMTTEMAGGAFMTVLDEMENLEANLRKNLNSLKGLLRDSLMS